MTQIIFAHMKSSEYFYVNRNNLGKEFDNAEVFKKVIVEFLKKICL